MSLQPQATFSEMHRERIAVLTDTCADIPPELARERDITVIPLRVGYPEGDYQDGVDITPEEVYRRMPQEVPKTSLPMRETVLAAFDRIRDTGYEKVAALIFSSGISGTYNAIKMMARDYQDLEIAVFDTKSASLGLGTMALQVWDYIHAGMGWKELLSRIPALIAGTSIFFSLDTLEYLQKGGRIGRITCVAGTMLQIKPIISFAEDGQLASVGKVRGRAKSMEELARRVRELVPADKPYNMAVANGGCPEDVQVLKGLLASEIAGSHRFYEGVIDCTLASHVGPHLIGAGIQILPEDVPL